VDCNYARVWPPTAKAKWSTGFIISKQHYKFGYFEAEIKAADIDGLNNAFWLVTEDHFEIDATELHFPKINRMTLHSIHAATDIRFSTALMDYAGKIPDHPEGHHMYVKSLRVLPLR
jgi:beta-glucanase (GH16 family)